MARPLHLKTKSIGKGDARRPVVYKTKATPGPDSEFLASALRSAHGCLDKQFKSTVWKSMSNVRYKDGDVVGDKLPELGTENKGRAMLEKMGWTTGMALGAHDNKGILQPVTQVVKRTKAGLR